VSRPLSEQELDRVAGQLLTDAITAGRLPAQPTIESLVRIAGIVRGALSVTQVTKKTGASTSPVFASAEASTSGAPTT